VRERSATDSPDDGAEESPDSLSALLPYWFLLAALAQLLFLFGWPMFVYGRWAPYPAVAAVALTRLGLYTALGAGLLRRDRIAWAGGLVEILRSVLLFLVAVWGHDGSLTDALFPAWWVQGLFSAVLPVHFGLLVAMEWGWRPGGTLEGYTMIAARILVAVAVVAAMSLRRSGTAMGVPRKRQLRAVLVSGLPFGVLITAVELAVWLAAGGH
jgi:hypothetical protein